MSASTTSAPSASHSMGENVLRCVDLSAGYARVAVVHHLNLTVDAGEVVAVLGPNGAGKTTSLLAIAGILPALSGEITFLGGATRRTSVHGIARRGVALVPDDRGLFYGLTGIENLIVGRHQGATAQAVDAVLDLFPALRDKLNRLAGNLSGGEQQMLAIGRAMVGNPRLLMLDELSQGLAPIVVQSILPTVQSAAREMGTGVLLVEQHVDLALEIADSALVLNHGITVLSGPARNLRQDRALLAASYLGAGGLTGESDNPSPQTKRSGES